MKKTLLLFLLCSYSIFAQNYKKTDSIVNTYPRFSIVENLANRIEKDFSSDTEKVRAAFFWLTKNIRYNLRQLYNTKQRSYRFSYSSEEEKKQKMQSLIDDLVNKAFRNKTGVCEEYAQSFKKICDLLNIKSELIKGSVRTDANDIANIQNPNHIWNAVEINNRWIIIDATWAAGYEYNRKWIRKFNDYYFDIPFQKIFKTHYPEDTLWRLRFGRMTIEEFYNQPIYSQQYLNNNLSLIFPKKGIIEINNTDFIEIKIKNLKNQKLIYNFGSGSLAQKADIETNKNVSTVSIKNPRKNCILYIYIENEIALQFIIRVN